MKHGVGKNNNIILGARMIKIATNSILFSQPGSFRIGRTCSADLGFKQAGFCLLQTESELYILTGPV